MRSQTEKNRRGSVVFRDYIEDDLQPVIDELEKGNFLGDEIPGLKLPSTESSYKVRVANSNTNVGKSNGYRLIYYVVKNEETVFLLTVYYKKDKENISANEIIALINEYVIEE